MIATAAQTAPLIGSTLPEWNEDEVRSLVAGLPAETLQRFNIFVDQFASFGSHLKARTQAVEQQAQELEAQRLALSDEREELSRLKQSLSEEQAKHDALVTQHREDVAHIEKIRSDLLRKEQELLVQEAAIRNGLVTEREESLGALREQVHLLEQRRDRLIIELQEQRENILEQARLDGAALVEVARSSVMDLQAKELELAKRTSELDRREERVRLNEELIKLGRSAEIEVVKEDFEQRLRVAEARCERLQQKLDRRSEEIDS